MKTREPTMAHDHYKPTLLARLIGAPIVVAVNWLAKVMGA